jgi:hypothetical protein
MTDVAVWVSALLGGGVFVVLYAGLGSLFDWLLSFHRRGKALRRLDALRVQAAKPTPADDLPSEDELLGLDQIPWNNLLVLALAMSIILIAALGSLAPGMRILAVLPLGGVWWWKRYLRGQREQALQGQIRRFLTDLRMRYTLRGSALLALEDLANHPPEQNPVYRQLGRIFLGGHPSSGQWAMDALARRLQSPHLFEVAGSLAAQQEGHLDFDDYLRRVTAEIAEEVRAHVGEELQKMPTQITFLAMPLLLGPIVVLLIYPVADKVLRVMSSFTR